MSKPDKTLDPKILDAAKKEFLEKGYEKASTNAICKSAGVTWGALQKRYSGKDALFCALVAPVAEEFKATLIGSNEDWVEIIHGDSFHINNTACWGNNSPIVTQSNSYRNEAENIQTCERESVITVIIVIAWLCVGRAKTSSTI